MRNTDSQAMHGYRKLWLEAVQEVQLVRAVLLAERKRPSEAACYTIGFIVGVVLTLILTQVAW